jgi:hypothetical protein
MSGCGEQASPHVVIDVVVQADAITGGFATGG